jgi:hypothetical protein
VKLHVLFSCDEWHTQGSKILLGVFADKDDLVNTLGRALLDNGRPPLSDEDIAMLHNFNQTQSYEGDGEFIVEGVAEGEVAENLL